MINPKSGKTEKSFFKQQDTDTEGFGANNNKFHEDLMLFSAKVLSKLYIIKVVLIKIY